MKPYRRVVVPILLTLILLAPGTVSADRYEDTIAVFQKSPAVTPFFETAYAYAVFPNVASGAIFVGASYGAGLMYRENVAVGNVYMGGVSLGFQLGGQAFRQIIFFQDRRSFDEFTSGTFEFDANASAVVITAGAQGRASSMGTTAGASAGPATGSQAGNRYRKGMAVFVHPKGGLMFAAAIGGQNFSYEPFEEAPAEGEVQEPRAGQPGDASEPYETLIEDQETISSEPLE
jgi:hypothetical protein